MRFALGAALMLLVPTLLATGAEAPGAVTLAVVALALVALVRLGVAGHLLGSRTMVTAASTAHRVPPLAAGRVTDPAHHPLRPRAPGPA